MTTMTMTMQSSSENFHSGAGKKIFLLRKSLPGKLFPRENLSRSVSGGKVFPARFVARRNENLPSGKSLPGKVFPEKKSSQKGFPRGKVFPERFVARGWCQNRSLSKLHRLVNDSLLYRSVPPYRGERDVMCCVPLASNALLFMLCLCVAHDQYGFPCTRPGRGWKVRPPGMAEKAMRIDNRQVHSFDGATVPRRPHVSASPMDSKRKIDFREDRFPTLICWRLEPNCPSGTGAARNQTAPAVLERPAEGKALRMPINLVL